MINSLLSCGHRVSDWYIFSLSLKEEEKKE